MKRLIQTVALTALLGCGHFDYKVEPSKPIPIYGELPKEEPKKKELKKEEPEKEKTRDSARLCEKIKLEEGKYWSLVKDKEAVYEVDEDALRCTLYLNDGHTSLQDNNYCDNTVDKVLSFRIPGNGWATRENLEKAGLVQKADEMLREGQKYACPENRVTPEKEIKLKEIFSRY